MILFICIIELKIKKCFVLVYDVDNKVFEYKI